MFPSSPLPAISLCSQVLQAGQAAPPQTQNTGHEGRALSICLRSVRAAPAYFFHARPAFFTSPSGPPPTPAVQAGSQRITLSRTAAQARQEARRIEDFKIFSAMIRSPNGIDALHDALLGFSSEIDVNDIASRVHRSDYDYLKMDIERIGSKRSLTDMAAALHKHPGTTHPPARIVYAKLRLTAEAITYLQNCLQDKTPVRAGRFIPCGGESAIRDAAAGNIDPRQPVFLSLIGHSLKPLHGEPSADSPYTSVFSPRAIFRVKRIIAGDAVQATEIALEEIARPKTAIDLPY
ncbi:MAG TPA: hypothetical protein VGN04_04580 [Herbaspirillum sp.]|jgi:hypothetical protein